jgi:hypothetical protein
VAARRKKVLPGTAGVTLKMIVKYCSRTTRFRLAVICHELLDKYHSDETHG